MAKKSTLRCIFEDLVNALSETIQSKCIFLKDRPNVKEGSTPMAKFCVIDLPVSISDYVIGGRNTLVNTTGVIYLFTQARSNNTLDLNVTGDFAESVKSLFPIKGNYVVAAKPVIRLRGADEYGYQVVSITFNLHSRWGAIENQNNV